MKLEKIAPFLKGAREVGDAIIAAVQEGAANPLQAIAQVAVLKRELARAEENIKSAALDEAAKYGQNGQIGDVRFEVRSRTAYDYSADAEWSELDAEIARLKSLRAARESLMRVAAARRAKQPFADASGEEVPPAEVKGGTDYFIFKGK